MRRTLLLSLAVVTAIVVPAIAIAGFVDREPLVIVLEDQRDGDVYRFVETHEESSDGGTERSESLEIVTYEGETHVLDRFGRLQRVDVQRSESYDDGELAFSLRCHTLAGGDEPIRADVLHSDRTVAWGGSFTTSLSGGLLSSGRSVERSTNYTTFFGTDWTCSELPGLRARVVEGERYAFSTLLPQEADDVAGDVLSLPAERTSFHGNDALRVRFDARELFREDVAEAKGELDLRGEVSFLFAAGLPVLAELVAEVEVSGPEGEHEREAFGVRLDGITRGTGAARAPFVDARTDAPANGWAPAGVETFAGDLAVPYPYGEALANLLDDPTVGLASWLRAHPEAFLTSAQYDRDERTSRAPSSAGTDGAWTMFFADGVIGSEVYSVRTARAVAPHGTPSLPAVPGAPDPLVENDDYGTMDAQGFAPAERPERLMGAAMAADVATAFALPPENVRTITYHLSPGAGSAWGELSLSDVSDGGEGSAEGLALALDPFKGGARAIGHTARVSAESSPLGPLAGQGSVAAVPSGKLAAFNALVGPTPGAGLAGGAVAATGLALLMAALKFGLIPFFTRLVRDRLLDNPVRGRLFERVRAEPGIRQNELVDFAGVGEGATRRHLDQLVKHRFLVRVHEGALVSYYAAGEVPPGLARNAALLRRESTRRVYELYAREPALSLREAGARLGMSAPGVHRVKKKLEGAGLLPAAPDAGALLVEA